MHIDLYILDDADFDFNDDFTKLKFLFEFFHDWKWGGGVVDWTR